MCTCATYVCLSTMYVCLSTMYVCLSTNLSNKHNAECASLLSEGISWLWCKGQCSQNGIHEREASLRGCHPSPHRPPLYGDTPLDLCCCWPVPASQLVVTCSCHALLQSCPLFAELYTPCDTVYSLQYCLLLAILSTPCNTVNSLQYCLLLAILSTPCSPSSICQTCRAADLGHLDAAHAVRQAHSCRAQLNA